MTTIAYRNGVIAADSYCELAGWNQPYPLCKLFTDRAQGVIYAACGSYARCREFITAPAGKRPDLDEHSRVIMFMAAREDRAAGIFIFEENGMFPLSPMPEFTAWGSGFPVALGAMHAGADAIQAVRIAAKVDPHTGGAIHHLRLDALL